MADLDIEFTFPTKGSETCDFSYDTVNQITGTGIERTMPKRLEYKLAIDFDTFNTRCHTDFPTIRDFYVLQAKGSENSFWYRCPVEYKINSFDVEEFEAVGDTYIVGKYGFLSYTGTGNDFQAMVVYHVGVNSPSGVQRIGFKTVLMLDTSKLSIRNITTSSQVTGYTVGNTSNSRGIVTLPAGSNLSHDYRWTGEYLHRMRFDSDLNATPIRGQATLFEVAGLRMVEKPHTAHRAFATPTWFTNLSKTFNPPAQPNYSLNYAYFNKEDTLSINKELITRDETEITATLTTDATIVHHTVKQYYLTWFNAMRGSLLTFDMLSQQARMADSISFSTEAWNTCEKFVFNPFEITLKGEGTPLVFSPITSCFYVGGSTSSNVTINPQNASDSTISSQTFYLNHAPTTPVNPSGNGAYDLTVHEMTPTVFNTLSIYTNGTNTTAVNATMRVHVFIQGDDGKYYFITRTPTSLSAPYNGRIVFLEINFDTCAVTNKYVSPVVNNFIQTSTNQPTEQSFNRVIRNGKYAQYEFWTSSAPLGSAGSQEIHCYYVDATSTVQRIIISPAAIGASTSTKYRSSATANARYPVPFHYDGVNTYYCFDSTVGFQDTYTANVSGTDFVISPYQSSYNWSQNAQSFGSFTINGATLPAIRFPMNDNSPTNNGHPVVGTQYPIGIKFDVIPTTLSASGVWRTMGFRVEIGSTVLATGKTNIRYTQGSGANLTQYSLDIRAITTLAVARHRGIQSLVMPQSGKIFTSYVIDGIADATGNDINPPTTGTYGFIGHHYGYAITTSRSDSTIVESFVKSGLGTTANSDFASSISSAPGVNDITKKVLGATIVHVNDNPLGDIIGEFMVDGSSSTSRQVFFKRRGTNHFVLVNIPTYTSTSGFRSTNFLWIPSYGSWVHFRADINGVIKMYFITPS